MPVGQPPFVPRADSVSARIDPVTVLPSIAELKAAFNDLPAYSRNTVLRRPLSNEIVGFYFPLEEIKEKFPLVTKKDKFNAHRKIKPMVQRYLELSHSSSITLRLLPEPGGEELTVWVFKVEAEVEPDTRVADKPHPLAVQTT